METETLSTAEQKKDWDSEATALMRLELAHAGYKHAGKSDSWVRKVHRAFAADKSAPPRPGGEALMRTGRIPIGLTPVEVHRRFIRRRLRTERGIDDPAATAIVAGMTDAEIEADQREVWAREDEAKRAQENRDRATTADRLFAAAGAPIEHVENVGLIDAAENAKLAKIVDDIAAHLADKCGFIVGIIGLRGLGKTQLAVDLIRRNCNAHRRSKYYSLPKFFSTIRSKFNGERDPSIPSEGRLINDLCDPHLLVVDECHQRGESPAEQDRLVQIIDRRYGARLCTLIMGNFVDRDAFANSMGDSIVSRMHQRGGVFECAGWQSYRRASSWAETTLAMSSGATSRNPSD